MGAPGLEDLTRLFLDHFFGTSLIAEHGGELAGVLVGFLSPAKPLQAYIHFARVAPAWRGAGPGAEPVRAVLRPARQDGRTVLKAITSPRNGICPLLSTGRWGSPPQIRSRTTTGRRSTGSSLSAPCKRGRRWQAGISARRPRGGSVVVISVTRRRSFR